ncbi:MAG: DUF1700 domain-containing protein [Eubacteriales bacterium]|nr:DUF1700 domain-containing protein [Eubacteriales bacterium]
MKEFLRLLREALEGEMSEREIAANEAYYRTYFAREKRKGRTEEEISEELGDPRLIARSILDADKISGMRDDNYTYYDGEEVSTGRSDTPPPRQDRPNGADVRDGTSFGVGTSGCAPRLLLALVLVLVVVALILVAIFKTVILVGKLFLWALPAILLVAGILWLVRKLK